MNFKIAPFTYLLLMMALALHVNAQKLSNGIIKADLFAPFTGNVFVSYQFSQDRKYLSPEVGFGVIGSWASKYTGQADRSGYYARAGVFIIHGSPVSNPKNIWRKLYIKPEIALFQQHAGYAYPSRRYNANTGFYENAINRESYDIKGVCGFINFGKQINFNRWVIDFYVGIGVMQTSVKHQKDDPTILSNMREFVFPIQGPFPIYSINTTTDQMQAGLKLGYQLR